MSARVCHFAIIASVIFAILSFGQRATQAQGCTSVDFKVAPTFEGTVSNGYPWAGYVVADFDGNGKPDVAETDYSGGAVVVLLNDGTGRLIASKAYPTGFEPRDVAVGDFNGDGRPDLVVTNGRSNNISVLLNSGGGLFNAATNFPVGESPLPVAVGDFNGDGKQDLAVGNSGSSSQTISVLLGNGNGSFSTSATIQLPAFSSTGGLVVSDFNSDGKRDLVAATQAGFYLLLGDGLGGFGAPVKIGTLSGLAVATADFNGDGKADLALGAFNGVVISLGDGTGNFSAGVTYPHEAGSRIVALAVGDVDGDSKLDVVVGADSPGGISFLKGDGSGSFSPTRNYLPGKNLGDIGLGDFDGDGDLDIVSGESILTNLGGGVFEAMRAVYSSTTANSWPFEVALGDFNGDGRSDLAVAHRPFTGPFPGQSVGILLRDASGNFTRSLITYNAGGTGITSMVAADFNKDGRTDIATTLNIPTPFSFAVSIHLSNGDGTFAAPTRVTLFAQSMHMATGDFNNDGNPDLVVTSLQGGITVLLGDGTGGFTFGFAPSAGTFADIAVADLNNDNKADLIITDYNGRRVLTELGDGAGNFGTLRSFDLPGPPNAVTVGDFNQDGKRDVAVANENAISAFSNDGTASVLLGDGTGSLGAAVNYPVGARPVSIVAADLDGDNKLDLATTNDGSSTLSVLSGEGNGTFRAAVGFNVWGRPQDLVVSDFDGDGRPDIATALQSPVAIALMYGKAASSAPCLAVDDVTVTEGDAGSITADVPIRLSAASASVVSVGYVVKQGSAVDGQDYTGGGGIVTFQPGETSKTIPVPVLGDVMDEFNESFTLSLSGAVNARISDGAAQISISDNDPPPVISINDASVTEGSTATFTVSLSAPSAKGITVNYAAAGGTATLGQDFDASQGVLNFSPGVTSRTLTVTTRPDTTFEPDETFFVNLSSPSEATIADDQGQGTIVNDDPVPAISIGDGFASEAAGTADSTMNLTVRLANPSSATVTVDFATADGTATAGTDYVAASGTVTFNPGETQKTFAITVKGDLIDEATETFFINLSNPVNATIADNQALCNIGDNDGPAVSINDVTVTEGNTGGRNATFTLTLSAASPETVFVRLDTADGTAIANSDYSRVTQRTIVFPAGSISVTTNISVIGDIMIEPDETFFVNLSQPSGCTIGDGQGIGTIVDDDVTSVQFSTGTMTVNETDGSVQVTVLHVGDVSQPITAFYATFDGTATQKSDYQTALGTIQFAAGETSKTITIFITDDALVEGPESFFVSLSGPGGARPNAPSSVTININSNDVAGAPNPIDSSSFFVRQHYRDFLSRDPDPDGLAFWIDQIEACGPDVQCREVRRINVSASFFLSIEFQQTGYLVERFYKTAFGDSTGISNFPTNHQISVPVVRFLEFMQDTQRIGRGVIVLQPGWEALLESNKQAYAGEFVQTARFISAFPTSMTPAQFVDKLNQNSGNVLSSTERTAVIDLFGGAADTSNTTARAQAVRTVAEDQDLYNAEYNRAFVLAQYFGYLRRNPNDPQDTDYTGYDFWLTKLNQFNGNYINAEMVKAFLSSIEYRQRFGP